MDEGTHMRGRAIWKSTRIEKTQTLWCLYSCIHYLNSNSDSSCQTVGARDIKQKKVQTRQFGPTKNNVETERLSNETGPEGCVLLGTSSSGTQEVPSISFSRCDLRVPVFTLRSIISTPSLHETGQASYCNPENIWHTSSYIFGRPTALPPGSNRATDNLQMNSTDMTIAVPLKKLCLI
ncbi:Hypothetical predicted protein, partial [Paramuricea clavata]